MRFVKVADWLPNAREISSPEATGEEEKAGLVAKNRTIAFVHKENCPRIMAH
jgi:hypothetical protein